MTKWLWQNGSQIKRPDRITSVLAEVKIQKYKKNKKLALTCTEWEHFTAFVYLDGACAEERSDDSDDVDSQLELQELGYAVVDVATPHDSLDDTREVVVSQDDVWCFLRYVCTRYTL